MFNQLKMDSLSLSQSNQDAHFASEFPFSFISIISFLKWVKNSILGIEHQTDSDSQSLCERTYSGGDGRMGWDVDT